MEDIILEKKGANFFGFERIGRDGKVYIEPLVIRGNGNLKLTNKGLYFSRWLPKMDLFIPIEEIKKVEIGNSHNGKWSLLPIIKLFYEEEGEIKVFGVTVGWKKTTLEWKNEIEGLIGRKSMMDEKFREEVQFFHWIFNLLFLLIIFRWLMRALTKSGTQLINLKLDK